MTPQCLKPHINQDVQLPNSDGFLSVFGQHIYHGINKMGKLGRHAPKSFASGENYSFVDKKLPEDVLEKFNLEKLLKRLHSTIADVQNVTASKQYEEVRNRYIALNRALTFQGHIAPRFRPSLTTGKRKHERTEDQNLISNDHQVLDLEWLCLQCGFDEVRGNALPFRWRGMFGDNLNIEISEKFAGTGGSAENKAVEILNLSFDEQVQLRSIQSEKVRRWWRGRVDERDRVRRAVIGGRVKNVGLRGKEILWPDLYCATKCADFAGLSSGVWVSLITGDSVPPSTLSNVKKRVPELLKSMSK